MKSISRFYKTLFVVGTGLCLLPFSAISAFAEADSAIAQSPAPLRAISLPPRLLAATSTYINTYVRESTYYFTIEVPANAGKSLQQVNITQRQGLERIRYDAQESRAFEGTPDHKGQKLPIQLASNDSQKNTVTVTFDQPIPPGKTVTIGLKPFRNPSYDGVYIFQLTAFAPGQQTDGQYIGTGRLQFYRGI